MALTAGTRLGPYEVLAPIGAGGWMGEVYRARDTKLDRDVAIKILPESFAQDPERLARFEREAKTLAALNHPNIAHVFAVEDSPLTDGAGPGFGRAIVMELHLRRDARRQAIPHAEDRRAGDPEPARAAPRRPGLVRRIEPAGAAAVTMGR